MNQGPALRASASPLFTPTRTDRASRRQARRDLAAARRTARDSSRPVRTRTRREENEELRPVFPAGGRPGTASLRGGKLKLPPHRMTTATASAAYPFLAEGGLGSAGMLIGRDVHAEASFVFDPFALYSRVENFTNPNCLVAGVIGQGKSALAKSIALRSTAFGYRVYVPCDPKGEWTSVAQAVGGTAIALGPGLPGRLNPMDAPAPPAGVDPDGWASEVRKRRLLLLGSLARTVLQRDLLPREYTALDLALDTAAEQAEQQGRVLLLGDVAAVLGQPAVLDAAIGDPSRRVGEAAQDLSHALRRLISGDLGGMFDAPSTAAFDPTSPMLTIDLSRLGSAGDDTGLVLAMTCASAWMESALSDPGGGRRWVIYDEAWRVMRHEALLQRMQSQWKLSRGLGIANMLIIHRLSDLLSAGDAGSRARALAEGLLADCATRVIYRQEADQLAATAGLLGLTGVEMAAIAQLGRGRGLWKVAGRSFVVQHLLHRAELTAFDTDARMHSPARTADASPAL
ncbi:ATP-binding protein [Kitasatospora sp. NPDC127116]|uniref:ATP-binding protein n=1 Tax=Kitasatospora sp. NPDC127116 TaxID=3345367 RepID=UPI00363CB75B